MRKIIILLLVFVSFISNGQVVHTKLSLSYEYANLYSDTLLVGTIKTHTNIDLFDNGYFLNWSSGSERIYHFIYPLSSVYDLNRMSFTQTKLPYVYSNDFKLFVDSIGVDISKDYLLIFNKYGNSIKFYNNGK